MHACVRSNHPISPLIILQSSNPSLYSMFALLHCTITLTRDKQCACCIRSKQDLYVYTSLFFFETWRFPAQNIITNCSQCEVPRSTAAGMEPVQKDHATVNFPGCKALPREAPIA